MKSSLEKSRYEVSDNFNSHLVEVDAEKGKVRKLS